MDARRRRRRIATSASVLLGGLSFASACTLDVPLGSRGEREADEPTTEIPDLRLPAGRVVTKPFEPGKGCDPGPDEDFDHDGFSLAQGDCNDCIAAIGPSSIEVHDPPGIDENCDGVVDEPLLTCDATVALDSKDPFEAARAIELCKPASGPLDWGVIDAKWVLPDGGEPPPDFEPRYHLGHGVIDDFGPNVAPRRGNRMLSLSSGTARRPTDPDHVSASGYVKGFGSEHPPGFPKESPACLAITGEPRDGVALEVDLRAPRNAKAIVFDFNFYTYEWPHSVCSEHNDFFVALMDPPPPNAIDGNISFDGEGNPVSVNNAFLEVCTCPGGQSPCLAGGKLFECTYGPNELLGTGFGADTEPEGHAATSWLETEAPVEPGEPLRLRFAVYDSENGKKDSSALIDNVRWRATTGGIGTIRIPN